jgi:uncharacterized membrane protein
MKQVIGLYVCLIAVSVVQAAYYYPRLPDTVASHFNFAGAPDGYMNKGSAVALHVGVIVLLAALFAGIAFIIPRVPSSLVSMPNKDYWLAPERRARSLASISLFMLSFGCATIVFMLAIFTIAMHANLSEGGRLRNDLLWSLLAVYGVFVLLWLSRFVLRFARVPT